MPGDLFPLPVPQVGPPPRRCEFRHRKLFLRLSARWQRLSCARHTFCVLNQCAVARARPEQPAPGPAHPAAASRPSPCQKSVQSRVLRRIAAYGPPPAISPREAVNELLGTCDIDQPRPSTVACFAWDKLRILAEDWPVKPRDITETAPAEVAAVFRDPNLLRLSDEEIEHVHRDRRLIRPYWDSRLRASRDLRVKFLRALADRGLVSFRRRIRSKVGIFFVRKKEGLIRMVIDARQTNQCHRLPPHVPLGSARAWGLLDVGLEPDVVDDLSSAPGLAVDSDVDEVPQGLWCGGGDLRDSFYQFKCEELGEDFGLDFPELASVYGCSAVFEDGNFVKVDSAEPVFPVFAGLAAGWSWAMWAMHSTVCSVVARSSGLGGPPGPVEDRRPAPRLSSGVAVAGVYVDNFAVASRSQQDALRRYNAILDGFVSAGLAVHELVPPCSLEEPFVQLGLHLVGREQRLRSKPYRAWRLAKALRGVRERPSVAGWQLRVVLGHVVLHFQLMPLALSVTHSAALDPDADLHRSECDC